MKNEKKTISSPLADITGTVKKAVSVALLQHKVAGNTVAFWRDGKIVYETLRFDGTDPHPQNKSK